MRSVTRPALVFASAVLVAAAAYVLPAWTQAQGDLEKPAVGRASGGEASGGEAAGGGVINVKHPAFAPPGGAPARGDGINDDTAALQAAIHRAEALFDATARPGRHGPGVTDYRGVLLYVPPGRYRLTGTLRLKRPLRIAGAGYNESVLVSDANAPLMHFARTVADTVMVRARIERLGFEGSYVYRTDNAALAAQDGLLLTKDPSTAGNADVDVSSCQFYGLGGAGIRGDFREVGDPNASGDKFSIDRCHFEACGDYGIRLQHRHATAYITRNHLTRNAGGIGLLGTAELPVSSSRILDNIIEANDGGPNGAAAGGAAKPFVGVMLTHINFCEVRGNYFEWHVNGVYVGGGSRNVTVARNWFDGNDVNLPERHREAAGSALARQIAPVHVEANVLAAVIEENDCYVPVRPASTPRAVWSPAGTWGDRYEVFPNLGGTQHELVRNSAREAGGRRGDVTYAPAAAERTFFESVQWATPGGDVVQHREQVYRKVVEAPNLVHAYPAGYPDPIRARAVLSERAADGTLAAKAELWHLTDDGLAFPTKGWSATGSDGVRRRVDFGTQNPQAGGEAGAWTRGSVRFNQAPAEAGPTGSRYTVLGWRCVADGSPGVWVEMRTSTGN